MIDQGTFLTVLSVAEDSGNEGVPAPTPSGSIRSANPDTPELVPFTAEDHAAFDMNGSDFSIAMWVNIDSFAAGRNQGLFIKGTNTEAANYSYHAVLGTGTQDQVIFNVSDGTTATGHLHTTNLSPETWYFIVCSYVTATKEMAISINAGAAQTLTHEGTDVQDNAASLTIGANRFQDSLGGRMDLVGVWKKALTSEEITSLYNSGNGKPYGELSAGEKTSLSAFWNMDEESDGTIAVTRVDSHTNGLDLTDVSTTPSGLPVPE